MSDVNKKNRIDAFGATILIIFSALLGLNQVMVKVVNAGMNPIFQAGLRSVFAFLPVLLFAIFTRKTLSVRDGSLVPGIVTGIFFATEFILLFTALDYTSIARASIFFYTMPCWVTVGAHFLIPGNRLTSLRFLGLVLSVVGVVLALVENDIATTEKSLTGDIYCLIAAVFWAGIVLVIRTTPLAKTSPEMQLLYQLFVSAIILVPLAIYLGETFRSPDTFMWVVFAAQVLLVVCVGFLTWFWILSIYPPASMASFSFLCPLFGVIFAWIFMNESISASILGALVLVSLGIVLINRPSRTIN